METCLKMLYPLFLTLFLTDVNGECSGIDCLNGGVCNDTFSPTATCLCTGQFVGPFCGQQKLQYFELCDLVTDDGDIINHVYDYVTTVRMDAIPHRLQCYSLMRFPGATTVNFNFIRHNIEEQKDELYLFPGGEPVAPGTPGYAGYDDNYLNDNPQFNFTNAGPNYVLIINTDKNMFSNFTLAITADRDDCYSAPCLNGATCLDRLLDYFCLCPQDFEGRNCENDINQCASGPCLNGGACNDGINMYTCTCSTGFTGTNCMTDIDECVSMPCQNGGTCTDAVNSYTCDCVTGYFGIFCQIDINECASNPCENGGTCQDFPGLYICNCVQGFSGIHCEINDDDCRSNPCLNGATCIDGAQSFTCICPSRFSGTTCAMDVIYITVVAVVLLILLVLSIILYREKKRRKKRQDTSTEPNLALPLGPLPPRPGSTPYDTRIVMTAPTHDPSHDGQLNHVYADVL